MTDGSREDRGTGPVDASVPFYTIGQASQLLGIQPAALRRIEEQEIVIPGRSEGGQRRYSGDDLARLREVVELTDEGVTLPGVRKVLALRERVSDLEAELTHARVQREG